MPARAISLSSQRHAESIMQLDWKQKIRVSNVFRTNAKGWIIDAHKKAFTYFFIGFSGFSTKL
tara:strand:- start:378 stop:566 length:189 start_codon:yes stop_codon:yes gene_type:complete